MEVNMVAFINSFLSYAILVIIFMVVIVAAVLCGKKLREVKNEKDAANMNVAAEEKEK